ncbi:arginase family protein [Chryseolinea sp. T2]|uniref:arginase family protein n=1 Tax=Chryseolinea sp. T2 TaxID=3129255 RepID=UPI0030769AF6
MNQSIQIVLAPSILGLKPTGVELLAASLINAGLVQALESRSPIIEIPTPNDRYSTVRDGETQCLNAFFLREYSIILADAISEQIKIGKLPIVFGGDCSILLGNMLALKSHGEYGLVFLDAHADYYLPSESPTGEVADMDLAIATGRGPDLLTNINGLKPYVKLENVIHIGQRDGAEVEKYGSQDIRRTAMKCFDLESIRTNELDNILAGILAIMSPSPLRCWLHFDTDVISDEENPAVDYRLPGGLSFLEAEQILKVLMQTGKIVGISVTIFNPTLDLSGSIAKRICACLSAAMISSSGQKQHP